MLEAALAAGIAAAGGDALLGGVLPTPAASILVRRLGLDLAAVVSASHNPYRDNGIKFFSATGPSSATSRGADRGAARRRRPPRPEPGRVRELERRPRRLPARARRRPSASTSPADGSSLDCANGATYRAAPAIFERLGAEVDAIAVEPDGRNINDGCGSTHLEALAERVAGVRRRDRLRLRRRRRSRAGGRRRRARPRRRRADRPGRARHLARRGELGGGVAVTVMTNFGFHQAMEEAGIEVADDPGRRPLRARRAAAARLAPRRRAVRPHHRHRLRADRRRHRRGADDDARARRRRARRRACRWRSCRRRWSTSRSPTARRSPARPPSGRRSRREGAGPRGPRPGPAAPLRHRAAGAGDGRGAERRGGEAVCDSPGRRGAPRAGLTRSRCARSTLTRLSCAESSDTWAPAPAATCWSPGSRSSSTAAMTRPASR